MIDQKAAILISLEPLFEEAKRDGKWFYHYGLATGEVWFSPAELRAANEEGRFVWGPVNWKLVSPDVRLSMLEREMAGLQREWDRIKEKIDNDR